MVQPDTSSPSAPPTGSRQLRYGSLSEALRGHDNALGLVRLVLASLVIVSHAFPIGGFGSDPSKAWTDGQETIGGFAVVGFFAVSGYLIAKSGRTNDIVQFVWRRALRIFPGFWFVLGVSAFAIGPVVWLAGGRSLSQYFTLAPGGPIAYLRANFELPINQYGIHDLFISTTPYGQLTGTSVVNGSLWTLAYEWYSYMLIAILLVLGVLRFARWIVPVLTAGLAVGALLDRYSAFSLDAAIPYLADDFRVSLTLAFLCGSSIAMYASRIPCDDRLGALAALVVVMTLAIGGWVGPGYLAFAYLLLWGSARLPRSTRWIGQKNDYSYGMYIFGWPVQQVTAYLGMYEWGYVPWVVVSLMLTAGCAWVSWHLVEKRAMALKDWGPGRGWRHYVQRARHRLGARRADKRD